MALNYATGAAGYARVQLLDKAEREIPGYTLEDADPLIGDELERVVSWQGRADVSRLAGQTVCLRMQLKDADVYSFQFQ